MESTFKAYHGRSFPGRDPLELHHLGTFKCPPRLYGGCRWCLPVEVGLFASPERSDATNGTRASLRS